MTDAVELIEVEIIQVVVEQPTLESSANTLTTTEVITDLSIVESVTELSVVEEVSEVVEEGDSLMIVSLEQGPPGPPGISENDMPYAKRTDFVDDSTIYRGEAEVGASDDSPVWRIRKITIGAGDDIEERWADGNASFTHVWADRLTLTYI